MKAFGHPTGTATVVSVSLAQIGEFSFILAGLGTSLQILPPEGRDLILAGAILSIFANPFLFALATRGSRRGLPAKPAGETAEEQALRRLRDEHVVLIGYGRIGRLIAERLSAAGRPLILVEEERDVAREAEAAGLAVVHGNAASDEVLQEAGIEHASKLLIAIPEGFEGGAIAERARRLNPAVTIIARAHSDAEVAHLERLGANRVVMGERETASRMFDLAGARPAAETST